MLSIRDKYMCVSSCADPKCNFSSTRQNAFVYVITHAHTHIVSSMRILATIHTLNETPPRNHGFRRTSLAYTHINVFITIIIGYTFISRYS